MFKSLRNLVALIVAAFSLSVAAAPASAQSTTTNPTTPTTSCGTVCPGTSSISATGIAVFGGVLQGGFGTLNSEGVLVAGSGVTGTVNGTKTGGGDTNVTVDYSGCGQITCGNTLLTANVSAFERGQMAVTGATNTGGQMLTLANSGTLGSAAGFTVTMPAAAPAPAH